MNIFHCFNYNRELRISQGFIALRCGDVVIANENTLKEFPLYFGALLGDY
jgi:hypothetical protein